jgi:hypothetical protein
MEMGTTMSKQRPSQKTGHLPMWLLLQLLVAFTLSLQACEKSLSTAIETAGLEEKIDSTPKALPDAIISRITGRAGFDLPFRSTKSRKFSARLYNASDFHLVGIYLNLRVSPKKGIKSQGAKKGEKTDLILEWDGVFNCRLSSELPPYSVAVCEFETIEQFDPEIQSQSWSPSVAFGYPNPYLANPKKKLLLEGYSVYDVFSAIDRLDEIKRQRDGFEKELKNVREELSKIRKSNSQSTERIQPKVDSSRN